MDNMILLKEMMIYEKGCPERIQHFIKVYEFAKMLGKTECVDEKTQMILETVSLVHDIGIKPALEKYGSDRGPLQEKEGIEPCRELLTRLGYDNEVIERCCYLVGHHHTYTNVDGIDYQILLEADYLVNSYENHHDTEKITHMMNQLFKTKSGIECLKIMYNL